MLIRFQEGVIMKILTSIILLFSLQACTYNVSLVNGTKNETGVNAPVDKNIPVTTEGKIPASVIGGL